MPIDASKLKKIAVIGQYADEIVQDWYSGMPPYEVTVLDGIREALKGSDAEVVYAVDNRMGKAVDAAKDADIAVVCVGNHPFGTKRDWFFCPVPSDGREAVDRRSMMLPAEHLPAILHVTHCSQEQGNGVADVLFGKVNPAGRTTQTWVADILDLPPMMDYDITNGRTYMYSKHKPLFPFGYGLSYTDFEYSDLKAKISDGKLKVEFTVANVGDRDGDEVPQLYISLPDEGTPMRLKAFDRINIKSGDRKVVKFDLPLSDIGSWNETTHDFTPSAHSTLNLFVGPSSASQSLTKTLKMK